MRRSEDVARRLYEFLLSFEQILQSESDLRRQVYALLPAFDSLNDLGKSLIPDGLECSARDRLKAYFLRYPGVALKSRELAVVAGISEWARRVRELRVEHGWRIITGVTVKEMDSADDTAGLTVDLERLAPDDYLLIDVNQDQEAARRWQIANEVRRSNLSMRDRIIEYLRRNVGKQVTGEELRYVAKGTEWARRVRELRSEHGWPISTKTSGNPFLPVGVYVLEDNRQTPKHDRSIPDSVRRSVLRRDRYCCSKCSWSHDLWNPSDPRFLEIHHIVHYSRGGTSDPDNLVTYCNVCHDELHMLDRRE